MADDGMADSNPGLPGRGKLTSHDVITALHEHDGKLASREQKVANYVKENLNHIATMTIAELAEVSGVSTPTVIRFCRSLGFKGFREFKLRLAQNLAVSMQYLRIGSDEEAPRATIALDQILASVFATANVMRHQIDPERLETAQKLLLGARQLMIGGIGGGSSVLAEEAASRFFRLGIPSVATSDSYMLQMRAATLSSQDVMLLISASGEADAIVAAARIASSYGASTISITKSGSRLETATQVSIALDLPEDPDIYKPTASRYAYLAIIDTLAMMVAHSRHLSTVENLRRIRSSLTAYHGRTGPQPLGD